ncbi:MAG TPA: lytic transglycosylase, partial [Campylobacterales bacterium]|nr:lytic transglycosylase [Campylobacterales bacterium]
KEFPSYRYVFNEFDIDESYLYDRDFQDFVNKNKYRYRRLFISAINRGQLIIPTMREIMYEKNISPLFLYLSMVESAFKTHAISSSSAGGLWQFVKNTAIDEKMQVNSIIDERYDPVKSTIGAIDYLHKIHDNLGKWYLTAMAYNCGAGCVQNSIDRARSNDLKRLINPNANYIRKETRDYIKKILLFAMIGENYLFKANDNLGEMKYKFDGDKITPVRVRGGERLQNIANMLRMDYSILKKINRHLKKDFVPKYSNIMVNIPTSRVQMFHNIYGNQRRARNQY